ncbi:MAG: serine hydroxymethyltransferase [Planctomycetota bacterium]
MLPEKLSSSDSAWPSRDAQAYHEDIFSALKEQDSRVYELITEEYERLQSNLQLVAAANQCSKAVLAALGSVVQNKTSEGFPGARCHGGCEIVDDVERLAEARAKEAFGAQYANVQPHSGSQANQIVLAAILDKGDTILSLGVDQGGHPSHGGSGSLTEKFFEIESYFVDKTSFLLDYNAIREQAVKVRPKLIMCGASAYVRTIDFKRFREIADSVGAYLLADISHIAGLMIAGAHPSCVNYAHFTTTSTYKAGGPRGGLILMGKDYDLQTKVWGRDMPLWKYVQEATFPGVQGTPYFNNMAAKAVFFKEALSDEYKVRQFKIIENAKRLASNLSGLGYDVLTRGTDSHMVLINMEDFREALTGAMAQRCLEDCNIVVDMIRLPYDKKPASITSGIRLGTPIVTKNGMGSKEMDRASELIDAVLRRVKIISDREYEIDESLSHEVRDKVKQLCGRFPVR